MAQPPSTLGHALLEPAHIGGLVAALLALIYFHFALPLVGIVVALELFYLLVFARTPAYARRVQLKQAGNALQNRQLELASRAATLTRDDRRRYQAIDKLHQEVLGLLDSAASRSGDVMPLDRGQLEQLKVAALDFSLAHQSFRDQLTKSPPDRLREELAELQRQPIPAGEAGEARRQTREILEQRIAHLSQMQAQMETLEARLQVIEQSFRLFKEQLSTMHTPAQLAAAVNVGDVIRDVEATRRTLQEMGQLELRA
jgi:hypothetical protein